MEEETKSKNTPIIYLTNENEKHRAARILSRVARIAAVDYGFRKRGVDKRVRLTDKTSALVAHDRIITGRPATLTLRIPRS